MLLAACLATTNSLLAGACDYYEGRGRIALSSDGNMHDNDDMHATKMTLMILAKAGLQDKTVLYTYADHIWGSESNDLEIMRRSAEHTGELFGFDKCHFMAAVEDPEAAYQAMCDEIVKSTKKDPLFIIAAGPMHVVGSGIALADKANPESLNHITVLSHSDWNNRHADNPSATEPKHEGWTWDEMIEAFGDRVNFNRIVDQNGTGVGSEVYKSKDKFSASSWEVWDWMKDHREEAVRWVRDNKGIKCGPDYSDAGLAYYLCADLDGVRGDEMGNPIKFKRWVDIKSGDAPAKVKCVVQKPGTTTTEEDFIAIEANASLTPLGENWVLRKVGDEKYNQIDGSLPPINGTYIEYTAGVCDGLHVKGGVDVLTYKFTPKSSGEYRLSGRMAQQLNQPEGIEKWDRCNDIFIKLEGDFTSETGTPQKVLEEWNKFYGRGLSSWGSFINIDVNHAKYKPIYNLKAGVEYTFSVSSRSKGICIDYFLFSKEPIFTSEKSDFATHNDERLRPSAEKK